LLIANAQKPPITAVGGVTRGREGWEGGGRLWESVAGPTPLPARAAVGGGARGTPWGAVTRQRGASRADTTPALRGGRRREPNSADSRAAAASAPGSTTPGWKIS